MNIEVAEKYKSYPSSIRREVLNLRALILKVTQLDGIDFIGEELKWGEPSFITKSSGSTIRIDWKKKTPECISIFFNCQTKLISTFKEMYPNDFEYHGNREIRLPLKKKYPVKKLEKCIELALKYNLIKREL